VAVRRGQVRYTSNAVDRALGTDVRRKALSSFFLRRSHPNRESRSFSLSRIARAELNQVLAKGH